MRLEWGEANVREVQSIDDLDAALDELAIKMQSEPALAEVFAPDGSSLAIGLGKAWSIVSYIGPTGEPPYFHSVGSGQESPEDNAVVFLFRGHYSDFPPHACVPMRSRARSGEDLLPLGQATDQRHVGRELIRHVREGKVAASKVLGENAGTISAWV